MDTALLWQFGLSALGGCVVVLVFYGILSLKLYRLRFELGAIRESLLRLQQREKGETRWKKQANLDEQLEAFQHQHTDIPRRKYANDPLER